MVASLDDEGRSSDHALILNQANEVREPCRKQPVRDAAARGDVTAPEHRDHVFERRFFLLVARSYILLPIAKPRWIGSVGWIMRLVLWTG